MTFEGIYVYVKGIHNGFVVSHFRENIRDKEVFCATIDAVLEAVAGSVREQIAEALAKEEAA